MQRQIGNAANKLMKIVEWLLFSTLVKFNCWKWEDIPILRKYSLYVSSCLLILTSLRDRKVTFQAINNGFQDHSLPGLLRTNFSDNRLPSESPLSGSLTNDSLWRKEVSVVRVKSRLFKVTSYALRRWHSPSDARKWASRYIADMEQHIEMVRHGPERRGNVKDNNFKKWRFVTIPYALWWRR